VIIDADQRAVQWLALDAGGYRPIDHSHLIDLGPEQLAELIDWLAGALAPDTLCGEWAQSQKRPGS
jgi:hypothetical protein